MAHQTDTLTQPIPMPRHTHLLRRGSRYYLNVKVPKDLRGVLKKRLIRKALKTSDPREAARLVRLESLRVHADFENERAKLRASKSERAKLRAEQGSPPQPLSAISAREAHSMACSPTLLARDAAALITGSRNLLATHNQHLRFSFPLTSFRSPISPRSTC